MAIERGYARCSEMDSPFTLYSFIVQQPYTRIQMATTTTAPAVAVSVFSCVVPTVGSHWRKDFTGNSLSP